jgi:hypothetical protein
MDPFQDEPNKAPSAIDIRGESPLDKELSPDLMTLPWF